MKSIRFLLYALAPFFVFAFSAYLTVSLILKTQQTTICPDVRGKTVEEARQLVSNKGLSLSILRYERRNDVPYNRITVQKPDADINTRKGRVVYVIVSEGPELIKTPGVIGQMIDDARSALDAKKLVLDKIVTVPHAKVGKVIAQIPAEGAEILEQSKITLFVGGETKAYYLVQDTRNMDLNELAEEMDLKKIKYKISYSRGEQSSRSGFSLSVSPKTIFNSSDELIINVY